MTALLLLTAVFACATAPEPARLAPATGLILRLSRDVDCARWSADISRVAHEPADLALAERQMRQELEAISGRVRTVQGEIAALMEDAGKSFPQGMGARLAETSRLAGYADAARALLSDVEAEKRGAEAAAAREARKAKLCERLKAIAATAK